MATTPTNPSGPLKDHEYVENVRDSASAEHALLGQYPAIFFTRKGIQPPSELYCTPEDILVLSVLTPNSAAITLNINIRFLRVDNQITRWQETVTVGGSATHVTKVFPLFEGWLLSAGVTAPSGTTVRGECFVELSYQRGTITASVQAKAQVLISRYIEGNNALGWPNPLIESMTNSPGKFISQVVTAPGAGNDWTFTPLANQYMRLVSVFATFQTSAAVANRVITLTIAEGGATLAMVLANNTAQTAGLTKNYCWFAGADRFLTTVGGNQGYQFPFPTGLAINSSGAISSVTTGMDAGDNWANIALGVELFCYPT